jgi:hypothetical protein
MLPTKAFKIELRDSKPSTLLNAVQTVMLEPSSLFLGSALELS